ncbi:MAG TPA: hypothetical protein VFT17_06970 [Propionibacteriaceae bacterium]|nr:hypothetical protein [Propionibacteriaceae bacterium]
MKHRSPLITLAAVAVAFAIMFTVNMLASPPGSSSTGTPTPATPAATSASLGSQETGTAAASPSPSASRSAEDSNFPQKIVYAGRAEDGAGAIAVAVLGTKAAAYFCDGRSVESWFRGTVTGSDISLKSKDGETLQASLDGDHLKGSLRIKNERVRFEINQAKKPAGLYRARGSKTTIGWIVLEDGSEVGLQTTGQDSTAAPELDPENPQVTVDGEELDAAPVNGDEDL